MSNDISELLDQIKALRHEVKLVVAKARISMFQEPAVATKLKSLSTDLDDFKKEMTIFRKETKDNFKLVGQNILKQQNLLAKQQDQLGKINNRLKSLDSLKSDIFTKIDNSYATPLKRQQDETDALLVRSKRHEQEIDRINEHLGLPAFS